MASLAGPQVIAADPTRLQLERYPLRYPLPTRWSHVQNGELGRVAMAQLYEDARVAMMHEVLDAPRLAADRWRSFVRRIVIEYLRPGRFPEPLIIGVGIGGLGTSSFGFTLGAFQSGACISVCDAVGVTVGADRRPAPLPDDVRCALERYRFGPPP